MPLVDDEQLLAGMHQKTRYSVRLAPRKGVIVDRHTGEDRSALEEFYAMLLETSKRNEFGIHTADYYQDFMRRFPDNAVLFIARVEGHPAAGLIAAEFGSDAMYMYGASDTKFRSLGAAFNLQFLAMQWGRERGAKCYDLWGIPDVDPPKDNEHKDHVPATKGEDWRGLYRFKTGFGGSIVSYPPSIQRTYHRQLLQTGRSDDWSIPMTRTLGELASSLLGAVLLGDSDTPISDIQYDSRLVSPQARSLSRSVAAMSMGTTSLATRSIAALPR